MTNRTTSKHEGRDRIAEALRWTRQRVSGVTDYMVPDIDGEYNTERL